MLKCRYRHPPPNLCQPTSRLLKPCMHCLSASPPWAARRGPLLLAGMVISALSAIFIVSCIDMWDAYEASRGRNGLLGAPGPAGTWADLANATSSFAIPHNVLPGVLSVPLVLAGAGADLS